MNAVVLNEDDPCVTPAVVPVAGRYRILLGILGTSATTVVSHGPCGYELEYDANAHKKNRKLNVHASLAFGKAVYGDAIVRNCDGAAWDLHVASRAVVRDASACILVCICAHSCMCMGQCVCAYAFVGRETAESLLR
eukprot:jgi/Mesvir1/5803/Mv04319-RA.1